MCFFLQHGCGEIIALRRLFSVLGMNRLPHKGNCIHWNRGRLHAACRCRSFQESNVRRKMQTCWCSSFLAGFSKTIRLAFKISFPSSIAKDAEVPILIRKTVCETACTFGKAVTDGCTVVICNNTVACVGNAVTIGIYGRHVFVFRIAGLAVLHISRDSFF